MDIRVCDDYVKVKYVDTDGITRDYVTDNEDFIMFMDELYGDERISLDDLEEPLLGYIKGCIKGEFVKHSANPVYVKAQLEAFDLSEYCKVSGDLLYFKPQILNRIYYKEKAPK